MSTNDLEPALHARLPAIPDDTILIIASSVLNKKEPEIRVYTRLLAVSATCRAMRSLLKPMCRAAVESARSALKRKLGGEPAWSYVAESMHLRSGAGEVHLGLSDVLLLLFELSRQQQGPAQKLVLQKNGLGADGCAAVVRTLRLWPRISKRLEHLCFLDNGIGDGGVAALADGLCAGALPRLRTLGLSGNSVSDAGARELARAVEHGALRTLRNLSLAQNNLSSDGVGALCASAKDGGLHQLRYLGLGSNSVGTTGAHALAMLLSGTELPRLSSLWLGQNPGIGTHGVLSVVDAFALRIARQLPHEVLWLQNTGVGDNPACISHVYRALQPVHPTLQPAGSGMLDTQMGGGVLMMMPRLAKLMMAPREPPRHVATSHSGGCAGYLEFLVLGALAPKTSEVLESAVRAYRDGDLRMLPCVSHWPGNRTACLLSDTVG